MATKGERKARSTQRIVNFYPDWADAQKDEQSNAFQFYNSIGVTFDDLLKEVQTALAGLHLGTTPVNRLDCMQKVQLPKDFIFVKKSDDDTLEDYYAPVVSGETNGVFYEISQVEDNELSNFISAIPSRLALLESRTNYPYLVASGHFNETPLEALVNSGILEVPSKLYVSVSSGENLLYLTDENFIYKGLVQLEGTSRYGYDVVEEQVFLFNEKQETRNEFEILDEIRMYGASNLDDALIRIQTMDFRMPPYRSAYYLDYSKTDQDIPSFWQVGSGIAPGQSTLDFVVYEQPEMDVRIAGFDLTYAAYQQELKDILGNAIDAVDLAVEPHSDFIWVVSHSTLYLFSSELPYMNLKSLQGRSEERACRIETDEDFVLEGDTITLEFIWRDPIKGIIAHRVTAFHEDGTKYVLDGSSLLAFSSADEYWQRGEPVTRHLRQPVELTLSKTGIYTFVLETKFSDNTIETDKRVIVSSPRQTALAEFDLSELGITGTVIGVHFDTDGFIWVLDTAGTAHKLERYWHHMLVDYANKVIYLKSDWDTIYVDPDNYTTEN